MITLAITLEEFGIVVGIVAGVAGLVLGTVNFIHQRDTSRPRVHVVPGIKTLIGEKWSGEKVTEHDCGIIEVRNVGHITITGSIVGFAGKDGNGGIINGPEVMGEYWPELPPGKSAILRFNLDSLLKNLSAEDIKHIFVTTVIGDEFKTKRRHLKRFKQAITDYYEPKKQATLLGEKNP